MILDCSNLPTMNYRRNDYQTALRKREEFIQKVEQEFMDVDAYLSTVMWTLPHDLQLKVIHHREAARLRAQKLLNEFVDPTYWIEEQHGWNDTLRDDIRTILGPHAAGFDAQLHPARIGERIRATRLSCGMTQEELSLRAKIPQGYISKLERGKHRPTRMTLNALAKAMKTRTTHLIKD